MKVQFELRRDLLTLRSVSSNSLTAFLISLYFLSALGEKIIPILFCLFSASAFRSFAAVKSLKDGGLSEICALRMTFSTKVSIVKIK